MAPSLWVSAGLDSRQHGQKKRRPWARSGTQCTPLDDLTWPHVGPLPSAAAAAGGGRPEPAAPAGVRAAGALRRLSSNQRHNPRLRAILFH
eukprot:5793052-Prymnesium_polylepis.1